MSWDKIILEGLKTGKDLAKIISRASEAAPTGIREILENFPESMNNLNEEDTENLRTNKQGVVLRFFYYYWLSVCGEFFKEYPLEEQRNVLETGVNASFIAAELAFTLEEKELGAECLVMAGNAFYILKNYSQAKEVYIEALEKYRELSMIDPGVYDLYITMILNNLGNIYTEIGDFSQAEEALNEALKIEEELVEKNSDVHSKDVADTLNNLGFVYENTGNFSKAEEALNEALKIRRELAGIDPDAYGPDVADTLNNLGFVYYSTGKYLQAEEALMKLLK